MLITLVTVTFNAGKTLERTLQSVETQTLKDVEHIIMDGASTDNTIAIAQAYKERNASQEIVIRSEKDKGLYDAMNKAIDLARGKYICFLNAGDKLHGATSLASVAQADALHPNAGVIYGDTDIVDDNGTFISHRRLHPKATMTWKSFRHGMLICHQAFYARRELVPHYDMTYRFSADFDWCIRIMKKAAAQSLPLVSSNAILADYLSEGMTTANHKASLRERYNIMCKHYGKFSTMFMHVWFVLRATLRFLPLP